MKETPLRLLVIADDPDDVQFLEEAFVEIDEIRFTRDWLKPIDRVYAVESAEALEAASTREFDAALLDLGVGGSDGLRAFQGLRERAPHLPVVLLADPDDETLAMALVKQGAQDYILKPELDCVPLARAISCAVVRQRIADGRRGQTLVDDLTGLWNERGFGMVGRSQLGLAARCGVDALVAMAEVDRSTGDVELLEAADAFRGALPDSAIVARLGGKQFAAMVVPSDPDDAARLEERLQGKMKIRSTTLRPQPDFESSLQYDLISLCENVGFAARAGRHL